jgi:glycosyltransferase involved in cell wall biosynthesis
MFTMVRGSAHIREQARLLEEEEARIGRPVDRPSPWMIAREEREYALADRICVLSRFAEKSFLDRGFSPDALFVNPLGVDLARFRPAPEAVAERQRRILSGAPLRVLNVGTLSAQKGAYDLIRIAEALRGKAQVTFVGTTVESEIGPLLSGSPIEILPRVPEPELTAAYARADLFIFTTIQDGFAAVLLQAATAGLPVLATRNCSAPDFVVEGSTGWTVPIRDVAAFRRRLMWCDANRPALAQMALDTLQSSHARDWSVMAREFINFFVRNRKQDKDANVSLERVDFTSGENQ